MQTSYHLMWNILLSSLETIVLLQLSYSSTMKKEKNIMGTNHTLSIISSRFWIISAREELRKWERQFNECCRNKVKPAEQLMGPIPSIRIKQPFHAFSRIAVDYGGPFITKQGRWKWQDMRYLSLQTLLNENVTEKAIFYW